MELIKPLKVCRDCGKQAYIEEDLQEFITDNAQPLGRQTLCKECKSIRGVLCKKCNYGIGLLGDNQEGVENALKYFLIRGNNKS